MDLKARQMQLHWRASDTFGQIRSGTVGAAVADGISQSQAKGIPVGPGGQGLRARRRWSKSGEYGVDSFLDPTRALWLTGAAVMVQTHLKH